jgi:acetyl esterase/lipase
MRSLLLACLLLPAVAEAQNVTPADLLAADVPAAEHRLSYGTGELHVGELRLPDPNAARRPYPVVMLVHGGCWANQIGKMDPRATALDLLRPMAAALASAGIATWNVEYRRVGNPGGGWPGTFEDLAQATDFLRSLAPKHHLDLSRVVVAGHSSGGHLAMWIAARPRLAPTSPLHTWSALPVKAVVNLDGPADPAAIQPFEKNVCGMPAVTQLLGGTPADRQDRYRDASPLSALPLGIPQEFVAGGMIRRFMEQVTAYQSAARAKGDTVTIVTLEGAGHFDMLAPKSPLWKIVEERFKALVR